LFLGAWSDAMAGGSQLAKFMAHRACKSAVEERHLTTTTTNGNFNVAFDFRKFLAELHKK